MSKGLNWKNGKRNVKKYTGWVYYPYSKMNCDYDLYYKGKIIYYTAVMSKLPDLAISAKMRL